MIWFSVRFDYDTVIHASRERVEAIARVLAGPTFVSLRRVGTRVNKRRSNSAPRSMEAIAERLQDTTQECVWLRGGTRDAVIASAQIQHGTYPTGPSALHGRFDAYAAFPVTMTAPAVVAVCELAAHLDVAAGFIAIEPSYSGAQEVALGFRIPREREGLSFQRRKERFARDVHAERMQTRLAGVEWGTFLGPEHLDSGLVDLAALRASGAFARVVEIVPGRLAFLQLTDDPTDDLRPTIEEKLAIARLALGPLLVDTTDIRLPALPQPPDGDEHGAARAWICGSGQARRLPS